MASKSRTTPQNNALHKYFRQVADDLNDAGYEAGETVKLPLAFTEEIVKEYMFKPIMSALFDKESTASLTSEELSLTVLQMQRALAERLGITTAFPQREEQ